MAQIAHARTFDGVDDFLTMGIGGLSTDITGMTVAAIIKPVDAVAFRDILVVENPMGFAFGLHTVNGLYFYDGATLAQSADNLAQQSNGWQLVAVTKPNGSAVPRWHRYIYTGSWTHVDDETTLADPVTPTGATSVYIGGQTEFNGMIACVGYWATSALSDTQLEGLSTQIAAWDGLFPNALWLLNQSSETTTVEDRAGTSDEVARTGTTATAVADLSFDVGGAAPNLLVASSGLRW